MNTVKPNLVAAVNLKDLGTTDQPTYQFVYASQLYDSIFAIYAKFGGEPVSSTKYVVKSCELLLYNYRGSTVVGFTTHTPVYLWNPDKKEHQIYFAVQGSSQDVAASVSFKSEIVVESAPVLVVFNRILYPMPGFEFDKTLFPDPKKVLATIPDKPYFDSEFCYRNGVDCYYQQLRPGMYGYEGLEMPPVEAFLIPSARCHQGRANLLFT